MLNPIREVISTANKHCKLSLEVFMIGINLTNYSTAIAKEALNILIDKGSSGSLIIILLIVKNAIIDDIISIIFLASFYFRVKFICSKFSSLRVRENYYY